MSESQGSVFIGYTNNIMNKIEIIAFNKVEKQIAGPT